MLGTRATTTTVGKLLWIKKNIETAATSREKKTHWILLNKMKDLNI